ncbi:MAG TPA: hypothetical protein PLD47_15360 [Aggregatilineales bacterium]|nr:hypothetical protein [Anaerolineales bacterium]HRE49105.1 hypothetical protein [Aggregatilineales bacterium]
MNISFFDQHDVPQARSAIRIESLTATPYPDGWRVKITLNVTPFQERPSLELEVWRGEDRIAEMSIIETMHKAMEFTVHIRGVSSPFGDYKAEAALYYEDRLAPQHRLSTAFTISPEVLAALRPQSSARQDVEPPEDEDGTP